MIIEEPSGNDGNDDDPATSGASERALISIQRGDWAAAADHIVQYYSDQPNVLGGSDILCLDVATVHRRISIIAAALSAIHINGNEPAFRRYIIVLPPNSDADAWFTTFWDNFREVYERFSGCELSGQHEAARRATFVIEVMPNLLTGGIVERIADAKDFTAIVVVNSAAYRADDIQPNVPRGLSAPILDEDFWVPQVHGLAAAATANGKGRLTYTAMDTGLSYPRRKPLQDLLLSIEGCGVMSSWSEDGPDDLIAKRIDQWAQWIDEGRLGAALRDLEGLPASADHHKEFLRIQLMSRAGFSAHVLQAIRGEADRGASLLPSARVRLARIAGEANALRLAGELLAPAIAELDTLEYLETALGIAMDGDLTVIAAAAAARLDALFPGNESVARRDLRRFAAERQYALAADVAADRLQNGESAAFYRILDQNLGGTTVPDYSSFIAQAGTDQDLATAYRMAAVDDAIARALPIHAFELVQPLPIGAHAARGERYLIHVLGQIFLLAGSKGAWPIGRERVEDAIVALLKRLADDPSRADLRVSLSELLEAPASGTDGLAILAIINAKLANQTIKALPDAFISTAGMEWLMEKKPFMESVFQWIKSEEPAIIGRLTLPPELLSEDADAVVSSVSEYLSHAPAGSAEEEHSHVTWLLVASAFARHSADPDIDLALLRVVAGRLVSTGSAQPARDLVEQALLNGASTPRRRRLAWFALADVYARSSNFVDAMVALACAMLADDEAELEQLYQEAVTLARLTRDANLYREAKRMAARSRFWLEAMGKADTHGHFADTLDIQIRHRELLQKRDFEGLAALLPDAIANGNDVLASNAMTAPIAAVVGQLLREMRDSNHGVEDAETLFGELLARTDSRTRAMLEAAAAASPSAETVFEVLKGRGASRYSADAGFDLRDVTIIASRALGASEIIRQPQQASFLLDLLADYGVALPGWDEAAVPPPLAKAIEESGEYARAISLTGISVVQAGFDDRGRLVRVSTIGGDVGPPVVEADDHFTEARLRQWAERFPFGYGLDDRPPNIFYTTTDNLRFSDLPPGPIVLIPEASLQSFPPNLLFVDSEFAGRTRPMASAPSLAWLAGARRTGLIGDGRYCAWISTAGGGESQTLAMVAERLESCFNEHQFIADNGPTLPASFAGSTLAVVTAHGGVNSEGRYFQMVSDEGVLKVSAGELANALRNVGIVILFVCSGGRADKHPAANTSVGLAKQILDRGCAAVIASPWPLDSRVPSHWLPAFLQHWKNGARIIEACFEANKLVDDRFAQDPSYGLAMTLFGNPDLRHPTTDLGGQAC